MLIYSNSREDWKALFKDERVSSWVARNSSARILHASRSFGKFELDYDDVEFEMPGLSKNLREELRRAAQPPGVVLHSGLRTAVCVTCWLNDICAGRESYWRREWTLLSRTCCLQHGKLSDIGRGFRGFDFADALDYRSPEFIELVNRRARGGLEWLRIGLQGDQRAVNLEAALGADPAEGYEGWYPSSFDPGSLSIAYARICRVLATQLGLESASFRTELTRRRVETQFWRQRSLRFIFNVLAEAILSRWSGTPLPGDQASAARTELLVQFLGWSLTTRRWHQRYRFGPPWGRVSRPAQLHCALAFPFPLRHLLVSLLSTELEMQPWLPEDRRDLGVVLPGTKTGKASLSRTLRVDSLTWCRAAPTAAFPTSLGRKGLVTRNFWTISNSRELKRIGTNQKP